MSFKEKHSVIRVGNPPRSKESGQPSSGQQPSEFTSIERSHAKPVESRDSGQGNYSTMGERSRSHATNCFSNWTYGRMEGCLARAGGFLSLTKKLFESPIFGHLDPV